jgi:hypothetical protein
MNIKVHLLSQSKSIDYKKVKNAYTKDGMYCVYTEKNNVFKYPLVNIFRVEESYDDKHISNPTVNPTVSTKAQEKSNPIQDNRIVKDHTFALRLLAFAIQTNSGDACGEDEKESMISYATSLLKYQMDTVTDKSEIKYLKNCGAEKRLKEGLEFLKNS